MSDVNKEPEWIDVLTIHEKSTLSTTIQLAATVTKAMEIVYGVGNVLVDIRHDELKISRKESPNEVDKRVEDALKAAQNSIRYKKMEEERSQRKAEEMGMSLESFLELQKNVRGY